jgi:tRNA nucleotidyltransferase/poly(A) polymerase
MFTSHPASVRAELFRTRSTHISTKVVAPVRELIIRLRDDGHEAWLAGGCVRDLLLGRLPDDFDVATSARPEIVQRLFPRTVPTGLQHGTVTVLVDGAPGDKVEVTTFRGEGAYSDGRRPEHVVFITDLDQDLARRDFTINAMALDPVSGELRDPFGGLTDLAERRVSCVGTARDRFQEDGLRTLRAVRFASVLRFRITPETAAAIPHARETVRKVAKERVRDEIAKLLVRSPRPSRGLKLLAQTGLLQETIPELEESRGLPQNRWHRWDVWTHTLRVVDRTPPDLEVRLAALLHDVAKPRSAVPTAPGEHSFHGHEVMGAVLAAEILERLRFPRKVIDSVVHLIREHVWHYDPHWSDGAVRRHLRRVGKENLPAFFSLREADLHGRGRAVPEGLTNLAELRARFAVEEERATALSIKDLAVSGNDLLTATGRGAGPWLGQALRGLLEHVLDHPEDNVRETLLAMAVRSSGSNP